MSFVSCMKIPARKKDAIEDFLELPVPIEQPCRLFEPIRIRRKDPP